MESNPLRGLFGVSSPRPVEQRVAPQPTENENVCFEIPSGMIEKLLANPFAGDGTLHPDLLLIFVDDINVIHVSSVILQAFHNLAVCIYPGRIEHS